MKFWYFDRNITEVCSYGLMSQYLNHGSDNKPLTSHYLNLTKISDAKISDTKTSAAFCHRWTTSAGPLWTWDGILSVCLQMPELLWMSEQLYWVTATIGIVMTTKTCLLHISLDIDGIVKRLWIR